MKGYQITVKYLYSEGFNPVLSKPERESYYEDQFNGHQVSDDIEQLKQVESLVLIFPTWWFSFPAILKGWFDRVWAPGHAYEHASDYGPIKECLSNLKEMKVITTLGSPWWVDAFILRKPVKKFSNFHFWGLVQLIATLRCCLYIAVRNLTKQN